MAFLIEHGKDGKIKITDLDSHTETPCSLCISSTFRLGYFLHDECGAAINKMTKRDREKVIKMLNERNNLRLGRGG